MTMGAADGTVSRPQLVQVATVEKWMSHGVNNKTISHEFMTMTAATTTATRGQNDRSNTKINSSKIGRDTIPVFENRGKRQTHSIIRAKGTNKRTTKNK
jgi:hypothetical protein